MDDKDDKGMKAGLIAPCGMNCRLCLAYQRDKKHCAGCRNEEDIKYRTKGSDTCIIKNCPVIKSNSTGFCFECQKYPCARLRQLDKRYRTKYHMSMVDNLENIKRDGIDAFLKIEAGRWSCPSCGFVLCVHRSECPGCKKGWADKKSD